MITVSDAAELYLQSDDMQQAAENTRRAHRRCLRVLVDETGPRRGVARLTRLDVDRAMSTARAGLRGRKVAESSLNIYRVTYRKFCRFAQSAGWLAWNVNPAGHLRDVQRTPDSGDKRRPLTVRQAVDLLDVAGRQHPRDRAAVALALFTGMRESEICVLRWQDIHWDDEEIVYYRPKQRGWHVAPFCPQLVEELLAWRREVTRRHGTADPEWFVIPARLHGKVRSRFDRMNPDWPIVPRQRVTNLRPVLKALMAEAGVADLYGKGSHTLRRTFGNLLLAESGDIRVVQEALGHKAQGTTEVYLDRNEQRAKNRTVLRGWRLRPGTAAPDNVRPIRKPA